MTTISEHNALGLALFLTVLSAMPGRAQTVAATVPVGSSPQAMAVNTVTNKIYVANYVSGNVTIIDGATNSTATVTAGLRPVAVAVNEATNKIHVANHGSALQQGGDPGGRKAWPDELYGDCHRRFRFCPAHDNGGGHGPMNSSYSLKTCLGVVWPTFPVGGS